MIPALAFVSLIAWFIVATRDLPSRRVIASGSSECIAVPGEPPTEPARQDLGGHQ